MGDEQKLNIYIDESGKFWNEKATKELSVVSFSWRTTAQEIIPGLQHLEAQLSILNQPGMFHTSPLIHGSGDFYSDLDIASRRHLFWAFFYFVRRSDIRLTSIVIDSRYYSTPELQENYLINELRSKITAGEFAMPTNTSLRLHYDDGQPALTDVLRQLETNRTDVTLEISSNHKDSRVFQAADYATFIDRLLYKLHHRIPLSKTEAQFFNEKSLKLIQKSRHLY